MLDGGQKPSFWETLPGVVTAIGTLLGGAAALITALYTMNIIGHEDLEKVSAKSMPGVDQMEQRRRDDFARHGEMPQKDRRIGQYIDHGDGTITDTKTGLMWKRCSEGLSGGNCEEGEAEEYKYDDAVRRFKDVAYAGYADWRLPTVDELKTLVYCSEGVNENNWCNDGSEQPTINRQVFPNTWEWYWSGSPFAGSSVVAWYVYFNGGYSFYGGRDYYGAVRLVRDGQ